MTIQHDIESEVDFVNCTLDEFVERNAVKMTRVFEKTKHMRPTWIVLTPEGKGFIFLDDTEQVMESGTSKDITADVLRDFIEEKQAHRFLTVVEAWTLPVKKLCNMTKEDWEYVERGEIHKHPDRIEVVNYVAEDRNGEITFASQTIIRDGDNVTLGPLQIQKSCTKKGGIVKGRFANMFRERMPEDDNHLPHRMH